MLSLISQWVDANGGTLPFYSALFYSWIQVQMLKLEKVGYSLWMIEIRYIVVQPLGEKCLYETAMFN